MKLSDYLAEKQIEKAAFAATLGVTMMAVHQWLAGTRIPRPEFIRKIADATDGLVTANDFVDYSAPTCRAPARPKRGAAGARAAGNRGRESQRAKRVHVTLAPVGGGAR